jgi:hypothetical protein
MLCVARGVMLVAHVRELYRSDLCAPDFVGVPPRPSRMLHLFGVVRPFWNGTASDSHTNSTVGRQLHRDTASIGARFHYSDRMRYETNGPREPKTNPLAFVLDHEDNGLWLLQCCVDSSVIAWRHFPCSSAPLATNGPNGLGRRAGLESHNDHVQQYAGAAHADRSVGIGRERNVDSGGQSGHIGEG